MRISCPTPRPTGNITFRSADILFSSTYFPRKYTDESAWKYQSAETLGSDYYTGEVAFNIFITIMGLFNNDVCQRAGGVIGSGALVSSSIH